MGVEVISLCSAISSVYFCTFWESTDFKNYLFIFTSKGLRLPKSKALGWKSVPVSLHETAPSTPRIGNMIFASAEKILSHVIGPHTSNKNKSSPTIQDSPTQLLKKTQVIQSCLMLQRPLENTQHREHSPTSCPRSISNQWHHLQLIHSPVWRWRLAQHPWRKSPRLKVFSWKRGNCSLGPSVSNAEMV